jgi:L-iditol 2-dehydrogenase
LKAAVYRIPEKIIVEEIPKPVLQDSGAVIKVFGCGLCGSDIVKFRQKLVSDGDVLGHEVVGEIIEIKSSNTDFKVGDRVALGHHVPCFKCEYCRGESFSMCMEFKASNIIPGGFAEYITVSEAHLNHTVAKIPETMPDIHASFMEPAACCLRAVKRAGIKQGDNVLVVGLGSIGLIMGQIASHFRAVVSGCDILDERLKIADLCGFDHVFKYLDNETTSEQFKQQTCLSGADKVILCSGNSSSLLFSLACVRDGGTITVFSSIHSYSDSFANNDIYYRELTVMGSYSPSPQDLHESLKLIEQGKIKVEAFSTVYSLDNIGQAINDTVQNNILKAYIKI